MRSFGYDDLGRTISDSLSGPGGVLREQTYAYDANDNRTSTTVGPAGVAGAGTQSYGYDRADRLVSWTDQASVTTAYGWDAAGQPDLGRWRGGRSSTSGTGCCRTATATYDYTARGTLSTRIEGATTSTTVFDAFDRLVADNTGAVTTYAYDGLDRLAVRNGSRLVYGGLEKEPSVEEGVAAYSRDPDGDLLAVGSGSGGDWATLTDAHGDVVAAFTTDGAGLTDRPFVRPVRRAAGRGQRDAAGGVPGFVDGPDDVEGVGAGPLVHARHRGRSCRGTRCDVPFSGGALGEPLPVRERQPARLQRPVRPLPVQSLRRPRRQDRRSDRVLGGRGRRTRRDQLGMGQPNR